jgi:hypothetical protein
MHLWLKRGAPFRLRQVPNRQVGIKRVKTHGSLSVRRYRRSRATQESKTSATTTRVSCNEKHQTQKRENPQDPSTEEAPRRGYENEKANQRQRDHVDPPTCTAAFRDLAISIVWRTGSYQDPKAGNDGAPSSLTPAIIEIIWRQITAAHLAKRRKSPSICSRGTTSPHYGVVFGPV